MITGSKEHIELSRKSASEGIVLLKNENEVLPLINNAKIALFGKGTIDYVKGGGGSSDVNCDYVHSIADGLAAKELEKKVTLFSDSIDYYREYVNKQYKLGFMPGMTEEPIVPEELLIKARAFTDTAIISFSRYSGEGWDRRIDDTDNINSKYMLWSSENKQSDLYNKVFQNNDFYLTKEEKILLETIKERFNKVIVVLNIGSVVDTNWTFSNDIDAVLIAWQGGMEGGLAIADVLCGDVNPSGHLSDTFAKELIDYPSTKDFHKSADYVIYSDDIYVGYRYFSTIPGADKKVNYPFGFGLSYTTFVSEILDVIPDNENITFNVKIKNTGKLPGKDVIQLYYSAPGKLLDVASRELASFVKTSSLLPGQSEVLSLKININDMKSYDDSGKIKEASWVMEKGIYNFYVGENVRDAVKVNYNYELKDNIVLETTGHKVSPACDFERLVSNGSKERVHTIKVKSHINGLEPLDPYSIKHLLPEELDSNLKDNQTEDNNRFDKVASGELSIDKFIDSLSIMDKFNILCGQVNTGVALTNGVGNNKKCNIPNIMTTDGPGGIRINETAKTKATSWPIATCLACTWDCTLVEQVGKEIALEAKENNLGIWLAPACNIHRSPLCGRNFEYFSEDPYLTGMLGSSIVNGAQSEHIAATPKHFAANNKETNRKASDSIVSERALREIYLKQFEMIVKKSKPYLIMSSYNKINGIPSSENTELLTGILRDEWGFDGPVTTDWWTLNEHYLEVKAGNDLKMAIGYPDRLKEAYDKGLLSDDEINISVKRILLMILKIESK